jgi:dipeptidase
MCDTIAIAGEGRVLFAKNSDRDPNEGQALEWHPACTHAPGTTLRCTWIEVPQVRETRAVLLSRPFWMWGAEMGANDCGVVIGNEAVFTRQPYARAGLTGMDLLRLALERAAAAREACAVIIALLESHGQGGGCGHENRRFTYHNSFIVADPREAYVLETAGRHWATERVEGARSISNGLTIPGFARRHGDRVKTFVSACGVRRRRTQQLAEQARTTHGLFDILRDHGEGAAHPRYSWLRGGMAAPCMHAGGLVAASQTTASWVAELTPAGCLHWVTATSTPDLSLFKPVTVERPLDIGPAPGERVDNSLWWKHERLARLIMRDPQRLAPAIQAERDAIEQAWLAAPPPPEEAFAAHHAFIEQWLDRLRGTSVRDTRPWYVRRYWRTRNHRAGV